MALQRKKKIKFVDLYKINKIYKNKIIKGINSIIENSEFINGSNVKEFEKEFAKINKAKYCQSCGNGTDAIFASLRALNINKGDEVILSSHDWISSSESVLACGAKPIFVDTKKNSFLIDENKIEQKITNKTKAIILVHIYGQVVNLEKILKICRKNKIKIIEDCAQSHLAKYKNKYVGTIGDVGCFSFFPTKNLGAFGDAGAILTNNLTLYKRIKMICNHGGLKKNQHNINGINSRLDNIQALILSEKLTSLKKENNLRRLKAKYYISLLSSINQIKIIENKNKDLDNVYHLFVVQAKNRDKLRKYLLKSGIETSLHYPKLIPFLKVNKFLKNKSKNFINSIKLNKEIVSLPFHPYITLKEIRDICFEIREFYQKEFK